MLHYTRKYTTSLLPCLGMDQVQAIHLEEIQRRVVLHIQEMIQFLGTEPFVELKP